MIVLNLKTSPLPPTQAISLLDLVTNKHKCKSHIIYHVSTDGDKFVVKRENMYKMHIYYDNSSHSWSKKDGTIFHRNIWISPW